MGFIFGKKDGTMKSNQIAFLRLLLIFMKNGDFYETSDS